MFIVQTLTAWVEAIQSYFHDPDYVEPNDGLVRMKDIPVLLDYPQREIDYPGIWLDFTMQGEVQNVGIGHVEQDEVDDEVVEVFRWKFGGYVELTVAAMGNLERGLILDELMRAIAVARIDQNAEGVIRKTLLQSDLIGIVPIWESITMSGFGEAQGTPWGTDDVIYEATITLVCTGEVVLNPRTGALVPLSEVRMVPYGPVEDEDHQEAPPNAGQWL